MPPAPAFMVRKCCVVKLAVKVALLPGDTECEIAPPSLQLDHEKRVPAVPFCGDVVLIVWLEPGIQVNVCADVKVEPSTVNERPDGFV